MMRNGRVDIAAIAERMRPAVQQWFNAHIQILRPAAESRTGYDPYTGNRAGETEATKMTLLYDSGPGGALVQPIRSAVPLTVATQATELQGIRLQAIRPEGGLDLHSGLIVKVIDGGEEKSLESLVFSLKGQPGTSLQWHAILEATVVTSTRWV